MWFKLLEVISLRPGMYALVNLVASSLPVFAEWQSSVWYVPAVVGRLSRRNVVSMSAQGAVLTAGMQWLASSEQSCLAWVYG